MGVSENAGRIRVGRSMRYLIGAWNSVDDQYHVFFGPGSPNSGWRLMTPGFSFTNKLFDEAATRPLRIDDKWRYIIIGGKAHGEKPDRHENVVYAQFCINFVLRGRGVYTDTEGRQYELSPGTLFHRLPGVTHSTWYDPSSDYAEFYIVIDAATSA